MSTCTGIKEGNVQSSYPAHRRYRAGIWTRMYLLSNVSVSEDLSQEGVCQECFRDMWINASNPKNLFRFERCNISSWFIPFCMRYNYMTYSGLLLPSTWSKESWDTFLKLGSPLSIAVEEVARRWVRNLNSNGHCCRLDAAIVQRELFCVGWWAVVGKTW